MPLKNLLFGAMAVILATACSGSDPEIAHSEVGSATTPSTALNTGEAPDQTNQIRSSFYSPLPNEKIRFSFPFHIRADRFYKTDEGKTRRGVVFEYLDGESDGVWDALVSDLGSSGYEPVGAPRVEANGRQIQAFIAENAPRLTVAISGGVPDAPSNPEAKGQIWINWEVEPGLGAVAEVP